MLRFVAAQFSCLGLGCTASHARRSGPTCQLPVPQPLLFVCPCSPKSLFWCLQPRDCPLQHILQRAAFIACPTTFLDRFKYLQPLVLLLTLGIEACYNFSPAIPTESPCLHCILSCSPVTTSRTSSHALSYTDASGVSYSLIPPWRPTS